MARRSIIQTERQCIVCHTQSNLHWHHIFFGPLRGVSEKNGFTAWLCVRHHTGTDGVHSNRALDLELKRLCQHEYEKTHSREEFMALIGKNYL